MPIPAEHLRLGRPVRISAPGSISDGWTGAIVGFERAADNRPLRAHIQLDGREVRTTVRIADLAPVTAPGVRRQHHPLEAAE